MNQEPNLDELLDSQRDFFDAKENWAELKREITGHVLSMTTKSFILNRSDKVDLDVVTQNLSDGSLMICYQKI